MVANFDGNFRKFVDHILQRIKSDWVKEVPAWSVCAPRKPAAAATRAFMLNYAERNDDIDASSQKEQPDTTTSTASFTCPDSWAVQINQLDCSAVWKDFKPQAELGGDYYQKNIPLVEQLIAMGGIRLASILNGFYQQQ